VDDATEPLSPRHESPPRLRAKSPRLVHLPAHRVNATRIGRTETTSIGEATARDRHLGKPGLPASLSMPPIRAPRSRASGRRSNEMATNQWTNRLLQPERAPCTRRAWWRRMARGVYTREHAIPLRRETRPMGHVPSAPRTGPAMARLFLEDSPRGEPPGGGHGRIEAEPPSSLPLRGAMLPLRGHEGRRHGPRTPSEGPAGR